MRLFENCLLASDIDETLLSDGHLPARNIERIRFFIEQGGKFTVATGRSVCAIGPVLRAIPDLAPAVVANGCMIYDYQQKKILHSHSVPKEDRWTIEEVMALGRNIGVDIQCGDRMMVVHETQETVDNANYEDMTVIPATPDELRDKEWNKVILMFENDEDYSTVKRMLEGRLTGSGFVDTTALIGGRRRRYYEQLPNGVSKAATLQKLREMLCIAPGCFYAIGDYYNDLEMLRTADISAATAGAPEEIRQQANFIAGPADRGAVADFIDRLAEIRGSALG